MKREHCEESSRIPEWLRRPPGSVAVAGELKQLLRRVRLNTVCEEARCPNIGECFAGGSAAFMIMGSQCTRNCRFCGVERGAPTMKPREFGEEAEAVAQAALALGLKHVVVTSVTRDDLEDGGAEGFVLVVRALKRVLPQSTVEVLIPDFGGSFSALESVLAAEPDVLNHNLETVPRLYHEVRPGADFLRSLDILRHAARRSKGESAVKTGLMLGLGETTEEVYRVLRTAREAGVSMITAGQYMRPSRLALPVARYLAPAEFNVLREFATELGFASVSVGPLVRSSYHAAGFFNDVRERVPREGTREGTVVERGN